MAANEQRKVAIAGVIWKRTTVSQGWIAEKLKMRHAANVSLALHRIKDARELPSALREIAEVQGNVH